MISDECNFLIISDIHLGGPEPFYGTFLRFLHVLREKLETNVDFRNTFRCLIINGDLFDLMVGNFQKLSRNYLQIYRLLGQIQNRFGKRIINLLGNHDVPVWGDFNSRFLKRKQKFISGFNRQNFPGTFLGTNNVGQYVLLKKNGNNPWDLILTDSLELIKKQVTGGDMNIFILHGHQFLPNTKVGGPIWSLMLKFPAIVKTALNFLLSRSLSKHNKVSDQEPERQEKTTVISKGLVDCKGIPVPKHKLRDFIRPDYNGEITNYLSKNQELSNIAYFIYGHTHRGGTSVIEFNKRPLHIINAGAWIDSDPCFIEVHASSKISFNVFQKGRQRLIDFW